METPLISIIIPTYNRAHLISETLDSIIAQTYTNWECIVVDDGSTDNTSEVMAKYTAKDSRFQYHHRPHQRLKGANACRNYGFELSKGDYIQWFDSDDVLLPDSLRKKTQVLILKHLDFVCSQSENIDEYGNTTSIYPTNNFGKTISAFGHITQNISCLTIDFMVKKATIKIRFNEQLKSGQEYNFISRYLFYTTKGVFIEDILAYRRVHSDSIQSKVTNSYYDDELNYLKRTVENKFLLLKDVMRIGDATSKNYLINSLIWFSYKLVQEHRKLYLNTKILFYVFKIKGLLSSFFYTISIILALILARGYNFMKLAKDGIK